MKPEVIAEITNFVGYANANLAATRLLDPSIANHSEDSFESPYLLAGTANHVRVVSVGNR